jgi:hypothetical protein
MAAESRPGGNYCLFFPILTTTPSVVHRVDESQYFGYYDVDGRGNFLVEIQLGKDLDQNRVLLKGNPVFSRQLNDFLSQQT